ncbi:MAG: hypothetical protein KQH59_12915 [Desulfobulbaceae bacterium]|nr:hypothetical protein [Desulfobulbaceae bacterium]
MNNTRRPSLDEISQWLAQHPEMSTDSFPWLGVGCLVGMIAVLFLVVYRLIQNWVRAKRSTNQ